MGYRTRMSNDVSAVIGRTGSYAKGVARRREILDRAIEVFTERGADGTSLRRIAQALGVSHAALLHYFDSREQLLVAVYEHAERSRDTVRSRGDAERAVDFMVEHAEQNVEVPGLVQLYSTLVATALEADSVASKDFFTSRFEAVRTELTRQLRLNQEAGLIRSDVNAADIATLIVAASDGLQIQWLLDASIGLGETLRVFNTLLAPLPVQD